MMLDPLNPLIVQNDRTLLLDVHVPKAEAARAAIIPFAELEKAPEHIHTYRITPLSLWNAASAGFSPQDIIAVLRAYTRYEVPPGIGEGFFHTMARYGKIRLIAPLRGTSCTESFPGFPEELLLVSDDPAVLREIQAADGLAQYVHTIPQGFSLHLRDRGNIKWELIKLGWPVKDEAPLVPGEPLDIGIRELSLAGLPFTPRPYQREAVQAVLGDQGPGTGYGVVVLPCGSGKTVVGMILMSRLKTHTLILTTSIAAVHQWIRELLDKTGLTKAQIAEYTGDVKSVAPVTVATYQILTWRPHKTGDFPHFRLFRERSWGLIIYDEVQLLPAPVFRITAELQAVRRLGLTATLVREDGAEDAVFSLVGPKRYDVPWKDLELKGWIAQAICREIRLDLPKPLKIPYAVASSREKYRIASENPLKAGIVQYLVDTHGEDQILVIGQYLDQLASLAKLLKAPLITGKTPQGERETLYDAFRKSQFRLIVVSKVANYAIDLPDASMAIQVSGSFGSRQEEAQRLGRILRPKGRGAAGSPSQGSYPQGRNAYFYTLVSRNTVEERFAANRQQFLVEQGYTYAIQDWAG
ncbi:MAG: helicase-associated domain-containing protein [Treponema sp.]|jgi:DNA excision repair protein ERCC-3|nr:helicase-associated domain-containing protein [Treponema sp.]